jgi:guanidinopropionase
MTKQRETFEELASGYAYWYGVPTMFRCPNDRDPGNADIALVGVPYTAGNVIERGQYLGPRAIRTASSAYRRSHRELKLDTFGLCRINDLGDAPMTKMVDPSAAIVQVQDYFGPIYAAGARSLAIGGDHGITLPILRALAGPRGHLGKPVAVVLFDSHTDAYDAVGGIEHAGSWAKTGVAEGLIDNERSVMIGMNGPLAALTQDEWANGAYRVIDLDEFEELGVDGTAAEIRRIVGDAPAYLTLDLDVLELGDAPAVSDPEVGGIPVRHLLKVIRGLRGLNLVGADVVEFSGRKQGDDITALTATALAHEILTLMAERIANSDSLS